MKYRVRHLTAHHYSTAVLFSQQAARLTPRDVDGRQRCLASRVAADPEAVASEDTDYFGNRVTYLTIQAPHRVLTVTAESVVEVTAPPPVPGTSPAWEAVRACLRQPAGFEDVAAGEFVHNSPLAPVSEAVRAYARPSFAPSRPVLDAALDLTARIHRDFAYDSAATTVRTALAEVLEMRRGVCQDFAHLEIAAFRAMGLAARYVSGYLLTLPPPGQPKLVGSDASHAWVSVWVPGAGWIDLDPTNDMTVGEEHIVCAVGRDFEDVSPIKGVVVGGGEHALRVAVDVVPEDG
jgi:transglutaminase-like putative cysteine protease